MKRIVIVIVVLLLLFAAAGAYILVPPEVEPHGEASARWFAEGPFNVTEMPLTLVDESRDTRAYGDYPGAPQRVLKGRIWRPDRKDPSPLILYSHGFMSSHAEAEYLGEFLATHGYVTAAVDYPLTSGGAPDGPLVTDVINQPEDASFVIDRLLDRNVQEGDVLFETIDPVVTVSLPAARR